MPGQFAFRGDDTYVISIAYDANLREYRATFINQNYGVHLSAPTVSRLKHRTVRLLRHYVGVDETKVEFHAAAACRRELASAA